MGQLYLIRHGKTALNGSPSTDRIRGWADIPLDAGGRAQMAMLAQMFESKGLDEIHSSDLSRASDTADAIAKKAGLTNQPNMAFRPWNLGEFQGQESQDVAPAIKGFVMNHPTDPVPGGESFVQFKSRFLPPFEDLLATARKGKTVALVTHYRCVKLAEAWLANGQTDQVTIDPKAFLRADLEPADVMCVYWDAPSQKWMFQEEDAPGDVAADDYGTGQGIPGYQKATDPAHSCATCMFFAAGNRCIKYREPVTSDMTCPQWACTDDGDDLEPDNDVDDGGSMADVEGEFDMEKAILCELGTLEAGATTQRIQVFPPPGDYNHPKAGPFTLSADDLAEYAADINSRDSIAVERDHAFSKGLAAPAAGWFVPGTAKSSERGVTAEVEWTPEAAAQVSNREYRFLSPEFSFSRRDGETGRRIPEPTLLAASLTNRPFFERMDAIAAEVSLEDDLLVAEAFGDAVADTLAQMTEEQQAGVISAAMTQVGSKKGQAAHTAGSKFADPGYQKDGRKRYALDNEKEVRAAWSYINQAKNASKYQPDQLKRVKARIKRAMKKLGIAIGADNPEGGTGMDLTAEVAEHLGIAADASEDEVAEAISNLAAENASLKEAKTTSDEQMKTLIADATAGAKAATELAEMKREGAISDAIKSGKIVAAEHDFYSTLWDKDPEGVATLLAEKPVMAGFAPIGSTDARVYDATGQPVKLGDDGQPIVADLTPQMVDGSEVPVDEDSARVLAAANEYLRSKGKNPDDTTPEEFMAACEAVIPTLGVSR